MLRAGAGEASGGPDASFASAEPIGSPLLAATPDPRTDGVPTDRVDPGGGCLDEILMRGGAEAARAPTAEAFAAAFLEIPKSAAFLAMLEVGSEPGFRPGDL